MLTERVLYLHTPNGFGRSQLVERLHRFIDELEAALLEPADRASAETIKAEQLSPASQPALFD